MQPSFDPTRVWEDPVSVAGRLSELGLNQHLLRHAVDFGARFAADCTLHDPPSLAGILAWGKITRGLRDQLVPLGWTTNNAQNYATTVRGALAIVVAAGDACTGVQDRTPSTRSEKGPATKDAVDANQAGFAEIDPSYPWPVPTPGPKQTWFLLHHVDEESGMIRIEMSLPAEISADGHITSWRERVILEPWSISPNPSGIEDSIEDDGATDILVKRRD